MGLRILVPRPRLRAASVRANKFLWAALGLALWGAAYTLFGASGLAGVMRARTEIADLEQQVRDAAEANRQLAARIEQVRNDPKTIERLAREEFFLAKPDEKIYLLPPSSAPARVATDETASDPERSPEEPRRP